MKVYIWGTGVIAKAVYENLNNKDVLGFIETSKTKNSFEGKNVYSYDEKLENYDAIIVANNYSDEIYNLLNHSNKSLEKIIFIKPYKQLNIKENRNWIKEVLGEKNWEMYAYEHSLLEETFVVKDKEIYRNLNRRKSFEIIDKYNYPIIADKFKLAGSVREYFWQDLWAARKIYKAAPEKHYDIGSRVDGFIAHLLTFRDNINLIDIRPLDRPVDGLNFVQADATNLDGIEDNSIESLSALCSLEHFGLGRYGDPIDPEACFKAFESICKKMKIGGEIYLSVPVGWEHVEFNAHRVFFASTIVKEFSCCELVEFSWTAGGYIEYNVEIDKFDQDKSFGSAGVGLFHLRKIRNF